MMPRPAMPKIEQVAIYTSYAAAHAARLTKAFGLTEWTSDVVIAEGHVFGRPATNTALLLFNHELGYELELIQYLQGNNWHYHRAGTNGMPEHPFLSHQGYHVQDMAAERAIYEAMGWKVAQEVKTLHHTNPYLLRTGRHYHYVVFDSRDEIGFDLKLIARLEPASTAGEETR